MEKLVSLVVVLLSGVVFYKLFSEFCLSDITSLPVEPSNGITPAVAFDDVVATAFSWMVLAADFNRNATSERGGMAGTVIGYTAGTVLAMGLRRRGPGTRHGEDALTADLSSRVPFVIRNPDVLLHAARRVWRRGRENRSILERRTSLARKPWNGFR